MTHSNRDPFPLVEWKHSLPKEQGVDAQVLSKGYEYLVANFRALQTMLVVRHGRIIFEKHNSQSRESTGSQTMRKILSTLGKIASAPPSTFHDTHGKAWNTRSVAKSILSALVGIALREKWLSHLDQELGDLLPSYITPDVASPIKRITLRHLLTMTSGLASVENGANGVKLLMSRNWTRFILHLPLDFKPGEKLNYNSANPHLISAVLTQANKQRNWQMNFCFNRLESRLSIGNLRLNRLHLAAAISICHPGTWQRLACSI